MEKRGEEGGVTPVGPEMEQEREEGMGVVTAEARRGGEEVGVLGRMRSFWRGSSWV